MYICIECENLFYKPKQCYGEQLEHFGFPCREEWMGSPCCEGDYVEAQRCELCGEWIKEDYYKDEAGNRYCESHMTIYNLGDEMS